MPRSGERQRGAKPCCGHVGLRQAQANAVGPAIENCCRIYNYSADAGAGSHTIIAISDNPGWRAALLGTVAAGTLLLSTPRAAKANCVGPAPTLTCTGTISGTAAPGVVNGGIRVPTGYSTLDVNNITANITPNAGVDGIYFHRVGAGNNIVINSDTTPKAIVVNGAVADGIDAQSTAAITIDHVGAIDASAGRDAIFAQVLSGGTALSITTAGELIGASIGIEARNSGTGTLSVVVNGDVAGSTGVGIYARNVPTAAGDLSITTGTGTSVAGGQTGILARNFGSHALKIVTYGDVVGTSTIGIFARNGTIGTPAGTYLSVTTGPGTVSGHTYGIQALNYGSGALTIATTGDVTGAASNLDSVGIFALNGYGAVHPNGDLSVSTGPGTVSGAYNGIQASNFGSQALKITTTGDVTGTSNAGIYALNGNDTVHPGTYLSITTGPGTISGGIRGIDALNYGSGGLTITTTGAVTGAASNPNSAGIFALNGFDGVHPAGDLSVSTGPGTVSGAYVGIQASNFGSQALKIATTGDVTGTDRAGIYALNGNDAVHPGTYLSITTGPGTISGGLEGIKALNYGSGALTITTNGDVTGTGVASTGIYARAVNGISIAVNEGTVSGVGAGVQIVDGTTNSLKNYGTVESSAGPSGTAIVAGTGNETVDNFGTITGSVDLGAGANAFTNRAGAQFNSGPIVNVGVGSLFANDGTIDPGDPGNVLTTSLTGNFVQSSSGVFVVDVNGTAADRIAVAGTANVAGLVKPNVISLGSSKQWTILTATGGVVNDGITVMDTPTIDFDLTFPKANEMDLVIAGVNFLLVGQNRNEQAIANNLNQIFAAGVPASMQVPFNALALLPTAVANALDKLSPEVYLDSEIAELYAQLNFTNTLMTCPTRDGAVAFIKEGECLWARASGRAFDQASTFQTFGFDETSWQFATGAQFALGPVWRIGGAFGYEHANLETDTNAKTEGDRFDGGAVLKYNPGAFLLAAGVSGGVGSYDVSRPITFPGFHASSEGDSKIGTVDGRLRAAYLLTVGSWYAKPMVDLDVTWLGLDGNNEHGGKGASLSVHGNDATAFSASPALEVGTQWAWGFRGP